ncbi:MAG: hypothetical protein IKW66_05920 [Clostridia bacterium]|nr:hypothetical protein [Clostridia bacterium]
MRENAYTKADDNVVKALDKLPLVAFVPSVGLHGGAFGGIWFEKERTTDKSRFFRAFIRSVYGPAVAMTDKTRLFRVFIRSVFGPAEEMTY